MARWGIQLTGVPLGFAEQLYTFGDIDRDPQAVAAGERRLSIAYLAFVQDMTTPSDASKARWIDLYSLVPWEDRRAEVSPSPTDDIRSAIAAWCERGPSVKEKAARLERADLCWSIAGAAWDPDVWGTPAALDHRRILTSALGRARGKLTYRPVVFELMPPRFTLSLAFDPAIRKIIYTTNAIESLNYQLRKVTKTKGHFPTEDAVLKIFYLAICGIGNRRGGELGTHTQGWRQALNAFTIAFPGRIDITTY